MAKFNKSSSDRGKSFNTKSDRKPRKSFTKGENTASEETTSSKKSYKAKRSFTKNKDFRSTNPKGFEEKPRRSFGGDEKKSFERPYKKNYGVNDKKPFKKEFSDKPKRNFDDTEKKSFDKPYKKPFNTLKPSEFEAGKKPFKKDFGNKSRKAYGASDEKKSFDDKPKRRYKPHGDDAIEQNKRVKFDDFTEGKAFTKTFNKNDDRRFVKSNSSSKRNADNKDGLIRLNKYLSNSGIASRRDADILIAGGTVKVNGVPITEMGYKVKPGDVVTYGDAKIKSERKVYLLLNKPKDYITTTEDPQERKTVMELIAGACKERLYPVGRLDRNTTGLLLFTNDGEMTKKLTHPKHNVKKIYHVTLNKGLKPADFTAITEGITLEDGVIKADDLAFVGEGKKDIGIEIHSGKNRIVRRIFEHLGYEVEKLDRVVFAGLTKKDLPRSKHRFLTAKEINFLQMIG
ncbi:MAG: pseudouridine synthase [Bacteroidota bacterium]|nr:pseudouridine synthase [Bacteroidota bacterium]